MNSEFRSRLRHSRKFPRALPARELLASPQKVSRAHPLPPATQAEVSLPPSPRSYRGFMVSKKEQF